MAKQLPLKEWNPYITSVPTSNKLKQYWKGFDDMANKIKHPGTLKPGTTGNEILLILKQYGDYPEEKMKELIPNKKPDTVRKAIRKLEDSGYVLRRKGIGGEIIVSLTRYTKEIFAVEHRKPSTSPKKLTRMGNIAVASMMFDKSQICSSKTHEEFYETKEEILNANPGCEKILNVSRMTGVYHHYTEIIPVFKLGNSMYWTDHAERMVKEYMEQRIFHVPITSALFFIDNYDEEAMKLLQPDENAHRNFGSALRESLELSSCYQKVFLITTNRIGINQLKLFRAFANIETLFLDAVFESDQRELVEESVIDGYIDGINCIVLFSGDIIRIKKICRILDAGMLNQVNIICYDFQEDFLRAAFSPWKDRVIYNSYSITELKEVFDF